MEPQQLWSITKVVSPFVLEIIAGSDRLTIELQKGPLTHFMHLLPRMGKQPITLTKLRKSLNHPLRQDFKSSIVNLNEVDITTLYSAKPLQLVRSEQEAGKEVQVWIRLVDCLKIQLVVLPELTEVQFYFSGLQLPKISGKHPREIWDPCYAYYKQQLEGCFAMLSIYGSQQYRDEPMNINGRLVRREDNRDFAQVCLENGYASLAPEARKFFGAERFAELECIVQTARKAGKGLWHTKSSKPSQVGSELQVRHWEQQLKEGQLAKKFKLPQDGQILLNLIRQLQSARLDLQQFKILLEVLTESYEGKIAEEGAQQLFLQSIQHVLKMVPQIGLSMAQNSESIQFLKTLTKITQAVAFFITSFQSRPQKVWDNPLSSEIEGGIKTFFKACFLGNSTFHQKLFGKKHDFSYDSFSFQKNGISSGVSSVSQVSDSEEKAQASMNKQAKKVMAAQAKLRVCSTSLLNLIFKHYSALVEAHWEMCVKPNILTQEFVHYLQGLKASPTPDLDQKTKVVNLLKNNASEHSLTLLAIFETSSRVKYNAVSCIGSMMKNFKSAKMIETTDGIYIEKLLKETKSSFIPRSYNVFSGVRNALYFLLLSLHYEKHLQVVMNTFKVLSDLCSQCSLLSKLPFYDGLGLLMDNYIIPVLCLPGDVSELLELKALCIDLMGVIAGLDKRWRQFEDRYLMSAVNIKEPNENVSKLLMNFYLELGDATNRSSCRLSVAILNFWTKLTRNYYHSLLVPIHQEYSIWNKLCALAKDQQPNVHFAKFVEEVFKAEFDLRKRSQSHKKPHTQEEDEDMPEGEMNQQRADLLGTFLGDHLYRYSNLLDIEIYVSLLNTMTYLHYGQWQRTSLAKAKSFFEHCFYALSLKGKTQNQSQFPKLTPLLTGNLVKIGLIKLVGYASFCQAFHGQKFIQEAIQILLHNCQVFKTSNWIAKLTWGLSNWCKLPECVLVMSPQQLERCQSFFMQHGTSDKEKIASNSTRGLGFLIQNSTKEVTSLKAATINNLTHPILKVRTNATRIIEKLRSHLAKAEEHRVCSALLQNLEIKNFNLQMASIELLKAMRYPVEIKQLLRIFLLILQGIQHDSSMQYQFNEVGAVNQLERAILVESLNLANVDIEKDGLALSLLERFKDFIRRVRRGANKEQAIMARADEHGEEAETAVFNKNKTPLFEEQKQLLGVPERQFVFEATQAEKQVLEAARDTARRLSGSQWQWLREMRFQSNRVSLSLKETLDAE